MPALRPDVVKAQRVSEGKSWARGWSRLALWVGFCALPACTRSECEGRDCPAPTPDCKNSESCSAPDAAAPTGKTPPRDKPDAAPPDSSLGASFVSCSSDGDCAGGEHCLGVGERYLGGFALDGYCTPTCEVEPDVCAELSPPGLCVVTSAPEAARLQAHCLPSCALGAGLDAEQALQCGERAACSVVGGENVFEGDAGAPPESQDGGAGGMPRGSAPELSALQPMTAAEGVCRPLCTTDAECEDTREGAYCNRRTGACERGLARERAFGSACELSTSAQTTAPGAAPDAGGLVEGMDAGQAPQDGGVATLRAGECDGICTQLGAAAFCSHRCTYGSAADCGGSTPGGYSGFCTLLESPSGALGDVGFCVPLCDTKRDCAPMDGQCEPFAAPVFSELTGRGGQCVAR